MTGKWFLISADVVEQIRNALVAAEDYVDERCAETGCMCDLRGSMCSKRYTDVVHGQQGQAIFVSTPRLQCSKRYTDAVHALDTGLHATDCVPSDWQADDDARE